jgi:hypothetical protein
MHLECRLFVLCRCLTLHFTLLKVLPKDAEISEHHRLVCSQINLVAVRQRHYLAGIQPETFLACSLVVEKVLITILLAVVRVLHNVEELDLRT